MKKFYTISMLCLSSIFINASFNPADYLKNVCKALKQEVLGQLTPCIVAENNYGACTSCCQKKYGKTNVRGSGNEPMLKLCNLTCDCRK
jgi:hypothetical protein